MKGSLVERAPALLPSIFAALSGSVPGNRSEQFPVEFPERLHPVRPRAVRRARGIAQQSAQTAALGLRMLGDKQVDVPGFGEQALAPLLGVVPGAQGRSITCIECLQASLQVGCVVSAQYLGKAPELALASAVTACTFDRSDLVQDLTVKGQSVQPGRPDFEQPPGKGALGCGIALALAFARRFA